MLVVMPRYIPLSVVATAHVMCSNANKLHAVHRVYLCLSPVPEDGRGTGLRNVFLASVFLKTAYGMRTTLVLGWNRPFRLPRCDVVLTDCGRFETTMD